MLVQTGTLEVELGLLLLTLSLVGLVSYGVYRDAEARGMADAAYWGAAVGAAFVIGLIVGGLVAVGVYLSTRPDEYEGGQEPFSRADPDEARADGPGGEQDPAHADLPPVPELTEARIERASDTAVRAYARRYDSLDATGDPDQLRAALRDLVERGEAEKLVTSHSDADTEEPAPGGSADTRRHVGRPAVQNGDSPTSGAVDGDDSGTGETDENATENDESAEFEWVAS